MTTHILIHRDRATCSVAQYPYQAGLLLAVATMPLFVVLPELRAQQLAAIQLALIAGTYFGFAAHDGRDSANLIESAGGFAFAALAFAGLWISPLFTIAGYLAHGCWDLLHHKHGPQADIPLWWVPFCVVYDWVLGLFLLVWWWPV